MTSPSQITIQIQFLLSDYFYLSSKFYHLFFKQLKQNIANPKGNNTFGASNHGGSDTLQALRGLVLLYTYGLIIPQCTHIHIKPTYFVWYCGFVVNYIYYVATSPVEVEYEMLTRTHKRDMSRMIRLRPSINIQVQYQWIIILVRINVWHFSLNLITSFKCRFIYKIKLTYIHKPRVLGIHHLYSKYYHYFLQLYPSFFPVISLILGKILKIIYSCSKTKLYILWKMVRH